MFWRRAWKQTFFHQTDLGGGDWILETNIAAHVAFNQRLQSQRCSGDKPESQCSPTVKQHRRHQCRIKEQRESAKENRRSVVRVSVAGNPQHNDAGDENHCKHSN